MLCAVPGMQGQQHRPLLPALQPCAAAASKKGGFLLGGFREVKALASNLTGLPCPQQLNYMQP